MLLDIDSIDDDSQHRLSMLSSVVYVKLWRLLLDPFLIVAAGRSIFTFPILGMNELRKR